MSGLLQREARLARQRHELLRRSQWQRAVLAQSVESLQPQFAAADRAIHLGQQVRRHAGWIALAVGALFAVKRPRGVLKLALRAWSIWRTVQALK